MAQAIDTTTGEILRYDASTDLANAWASADSIVGHDLVAKSNQEMFEKLCGTPFLITRVTFRPSDMQPKGLSYRPDYVSVEAVIPTADVLLARLKFAGIRVEDLPFQPGQMIIFNDGSTGVRRQIVEYLSEKGVLPEREGPKGGPSGESVYDQPVATDDAEEFNVRLACPRGLRRSEYSNDYTSDAATYYLA